MDASVIDSICELTAWFLLVACKLPNLNIRPRNRPGTAHSTVLDWIPGCLAWILNLDTRLLGYWAGLDSHSQEVLHADPV